MRKVIITAPSLNPSLNVSGISSVVRFIIENNKEVEYLHFELGKQDSEHRGLRSIRRLMSCYRKWKALLMSCQQAEEKPLVHYSFPLSVPSILRDPWFMFYAKHHDYNMIVHLHGGLFLNAKHTPWFLKMILKWVFSWNVPFIVLSEMEKKIVEERYGAKNVHILPNCVSIPAEEECHKHDDSCPLQLGYLGRIEPNKGMTELLEACKMLNEKGIPFVLHLAGKEQTEGEYIPLFQQMLGDKFHYAGLVSGEKKQQFLQTLDLLVMPTYFEGLPMSLLECMSYGIAPVITDVGSVSTVVKDGDNGVIIQLKDSQSIVNAIAYLHSHRDILASLGRNARETIVRQFSPKEYSLTLNRIYDNPKNAFQ